MRLLLKGQVKAYEGQSVSFHATMKKGMKQAFCPIFSNVSGFEPSPHIEVEKIGILDQGKPRFTKPAMITLNELNRSSSLEVVAEQDCTFYFYQDIDVEGDPLVKAKVKVHGKARHIIKRFLSALRRHVGKR